jgi:hypothetical protein
VGRYKVAKLIYLAWPRVRGRGVTNLSEGGVTPQPQPPRVLADKVWCPRCGEYLKFVRVAQAANIVDVDRRTVYNYIKKNKVYALKVAGGTLRICTHCLLRDANSA